MDLFKLVGSIFIKNEDANSQIDKTREKGKQLGESLGKSMKTAGDKITSIGKALAPLSVATGAMLSASFKGGSDFTNGMAKMSTLFDTSKTSVSDLSKQFLDLSNKTGISATELAEAGYQALSAGVDVQDAGKFVETAGNLAKAGFTTTSTAVDVLTTAMNAYGDEAGSAEEIANKLVRTQNLGKTTVDELAQSMGRIIPTASAMGVDINNLTSGYVSLTKQGISTAESTTYMNAMLNELGDSGSTLGGILQEKTGKSFQELMDSGMSLADVLQITKDYADENDVAYNELWGSAEAGKAGLAILNGGVEEFNGTLETMKSDTDDVGTALEKLDTPSAKLNKALNRVKNAGISLGTSLLTALTPAIDTAGSVIEKVTDWFGGLSDKVKVVIGSVMGFITALSPVLIVGGKIISVVGGIIGKIGALTGSGSALATVLGALSNPVTAVIAVILALVGAFVLAYNKSESFRNQVNSAWDQIKTKIQTVVQLISQIIQTTLPYVLIGFQTVINAIKLAWQTFGSDIIGILSSVFNVISTIIQSVLDVIIAMVKTGLALLKGDWKGAWEGLKSIVSSVWNGIIAVILALVGVLASYIKLKLNIIKNIWKNAWNIFKTIVKTSWTGVKTATKVGINAVKTAVQTGMNVVKNKVKSILNAVKSTFKNVWNTCKTTVSNAINGVKSNVSSGMSSVKSKITSVLNSIKTKFKNVWDKCKSTVSDAITAIKSKTKFTWSLPHLKLPHPSVSGKFSLNPPSVPKFSIKWYKKAMENPFLFTKPTIFDMNPVTGEAKGAGEAGNEMMYSHEKLMNDIRTASGNQELKEAFEEWMNKIFDLFLVYFPQFANMQMVTDTGALVGQMTPLIDKKLGIVATHKGRGI